MQVAGTDPNRGPNVPLEFPLFADAVLQVQNLPLTLRRRLPALPAAHATRGAAAARRRTVRPCPTGQCGTINWSLLSFVLRAA